MPPYHHETLRSEGNHCTALAFTVLHCTPLYCPAISCTILHYPALSCTVLSCTVLHGPELSCTALSCTALCFTALSFAPSRVTYDSTLSHNLPKMFLPMTSMTCIADLLAARVGTLSEAQPTSHSSPILPTHTSTRDSLPA